MVLWRVNVKLTVGLSTSLKLALELLVTGIARIPVDHERASLYLSDAPATGTAPSYVLLGLNSHVIPLYTGYGESLDARRR
jgi:hypothetical protein